MQTCEGKHIWTWFSLRGFCCGSGLTSDNDAKNTDQKSRKGSTTENLGKQPGGMLVCGS